MTTFIRLAAVAVLFLSFSVCRAEVDFTVQKRLKLEEAPIDITMAASGRWLYVLTQTGHLRVYSHAGAFIGKMAVGPTFDQIQPGPTDELIYLKSRSDKSIQIMEVVYNHAISTSNSPYKGNKDAPIVIVDYTDFQCPYCAKLLPIFKTLLKRYPKKIKIVYKNYPLRSHQFAKKAASAAMAAHLKGKFWEFHDRLYANYYRMSDEAIDNIRKELGLDTAEFETLMNSPKIERMIRQDILQGQNIGVRSTPTVFVNGKLQKDKRLEGFIETIENELNALK